MQDGNTALIRAATNGDVDIVINLISRGANKEHKNKVRRVRVVDIFFFSI